MEGRKLRFGMLTVLTNIRSTKVLVGGRQPSVEDTLRWKMTFSGRHLRWKMTFGGRLPMHLYSNTAKPECGASASI